MRILVLSSWVFLPRFSGARRVIYNAASGLADLGHEVLVLCAVGEQVIPVGIDNFKLDSIPIKRILVIIYFKLDVILGRVFRFIWAPLSNLIRSKILDISLEYQLIDKMASFGPDIVLAEDMYIAQVGLRISKLLGVPFAYRIHHIYCIQYSWNKLFYKIVEKWELTVLKNANALITLTQEDKEFIKNKWQLKAEESPIGIKEKAQIVGKIEKLLDCSNPYILYISSYLGKEVYWLKVLANYFPYINIVFLGYGSDTRIKLPNNILRLGTVSEFELAVLYHHCQFVFFPLEWTPGQGLPIKLAEALKSDKPILLNSKAAWLLSQDTIGIFTFSGEQELYEKGDYLLKEKCPLYNRGELFDHHNASKYLEKMLKNFIQRGL